MTARSQVFAVGFMLEDLQQYRSAALVYMECVRTIEHLQQMQQHQPRPPVAAALSLASPPFPSALPPTSLPQPSELDKLQMDPAHLHRRSLPPDCSNFTRKRHKNTRHKHFKYCIGRMIYQNLNC